MIKSYQINVIGRVQGVGFRWYTKQTADKHHIVGWVKNELDGSVTIAAQGDAENMAAFLHDIATGPGFYSQVDWVTKKIIATFNANNFAIR